MSDERHDPDFIANIAGKILSEQLSQTVSLRKRKVFTTAASIVVRCDVFDNCFALPASFIVKKAREDEFEWRPDSPETPNPAHWLFNDWAASEFLNAIPSATPFSPSLYGGSKDYGLIVLEDLGDGETPDTFDALCGDDAELAEETLIEHVSLIGQLHAATIWRHDEYRRIRQRLGPLPNPEKLFQDPWSDARLHAIRSGEVKEAIKLYRTVCESVGIHQQPGITDEIALVTADVEEQPGLFLAFCKGDQNLAGDYIRRNGQPRLFDFNASGFRHALVEGMPGRMTWGCMMRIPARILPLMDAAYQTELKHTHPEMSDEILRRALVEAGARWHIFHVVHRLREALINDRQRGPTTLRQQMIAWLEAFADLSEALSFFPALGTSARRLAERLCKVWPVEASNLPYYPAFRSQVR
jgi:hypothetical protein